MSVWEKIRRPYHWQIREWLLLSVLFSLLLLGGRVLVSGSLAYLFLPWNLFLAAIPFRITQWMSRDLRLPEHPWIFRGLLLGWLLFIPNSFYIITDLFHLTHIDSAPKWFDLLLLFSFAWNGLLLGVISLRRMELILELKTGRSVSVLLVAVVMWLSAFGIYIGRYLRFNSWDVLTNPFSLFGTLAERILHPLAYASAWGMTAMYGLFMTLLYYSLRKMSESFERRVA